MSQDPTFTIAVKNVTVPHLPTCQTKSIAMNQWLLILIDVIALTIAGFLKIVRNRFETFVTAFDTSDAVTITKLSITFNRRSLK